MKRGQKQRGQLRFAVYCRCSTDDQKEGDFTTVQVQESVNRDYVEKRGGTLVGIYKDEGITGTIIRRPDLKRLFDDAATGKFDAVVVTYMSRLGRGDAYTIAAYELGKSNVQVDTVNEKFSDDLAGYVNKSMTVMMDGMYPKMVSQWTKTKLHAMHANGYFCGGLLPYGYQAVPVEGMSV